MALMYCPWTRIAARRLAQIGPLAPEGARFAPRCAWSAVRRSPDSLGVGDVLLVNGREQSWDGALGCKPHEPHSLRDAGPQESPDETPRRVFPQCFASVHG